MVSKELPNSIGQLYYEINDVRGDGNCFYRTIYNIAQESEKAQDEFMLSKVDEEEGIENIRIYIANALRSVWEKDAIDSIHMICDILKEGDMNLYNDLHELYPFLDINLCNKNKKNRIEYVADRIENINEAMFASEIEKDIIKRDLEAVADVSLLVISKNNEDRITLERKWKRDLLGLLQNSTKKYVAIIVNKDNLHYQFLKFKRHTNDPKYYAIINRQMAIRYITNTGSIKTLRGGSFFLAKTKH